MKSQSSWQKFEKRAERICVQNAALALLLALTVCFGFAGCSTDVAHALAKETIVVFSFSEERVYSITAAWGTDQNDLGLPETLTANVVVDAGDGDQPQTAETLEVCEVPVSWECANYDLETEGDYTFLAKLEPDYFYDGEMPVLIVTILAAMPDEASASDQSATPDESVVPEMEATSLPEITPEPSATLEPSATPEISPTPDPALDFVITAFLNEPIEIFVERGTPIENIPLPAMLPAINGNGMEIEVPVKWENVIADAECDPNDYISNSKHGYGPWLFTASIQNAPMTADADTLDPTGVVDGAEESDKTNSASLEYSYIYSGEPVMASVRIFDCSIINHICGIAEDGLLFRFVILTGHTLNLPIEVSALMDDDGYKNVPVRWIGECDVDTPGVYDFVMEIDSGYTGGYAIAEVVVVKNID